TPQEVGDVKAVFAGDDPEHGREAFVDAPVVGLVAAAFDFLRLFSVKVNQLHLAPSWAGPGPPRHAITVAFLRELSAVLWLARLYSPLASFASSRRRLLNVSNSTCHFA